MPIGGVYDTGTVAVVNGSATVVGTGVFWPDVLEGDHLLIAGLVSLVLSVNTGTNTITLMKPYAGASNAAATYQLVKMSWLRYDPSTVMIQVRDFLSRIKDSNTGLFYYTVGTPDPAIGENGDLAIDVTTELWMFWKKAAGIWELQTPVFTEGSSATTGDLKPTHKTVADPSWIMWADGSIGDATSGALIRANADTLALFSLYYNHYTAAECPLQTSSGVATTRAAQGTEAAAFAAHCRMFVPVGVGRSLSIAGAGSGLTARTLGGADGAESITLTEANLPLAEIGVHDGSNYFKLLGLGSGAQAGYFGRPLTEFPNAFGLGQAPAILRNGVSLPKSVINPRSYLNVMIKL
jgi:hypothetical protein